MIHNYSLPTKTKFEFCIILTYSLRYVKLDGVALLIADTPTAEASPIGKIQPFSKMAVTFKPLMQF